MKFDKIVCVDESGLTPDGYAQLRQFSDNPIIRYPDYPTSNAVILERMQDADCVLVSWNTQITAEVIRATNQLKYIGMCCSLIDPSSANVDIHQARQQNITVRGVRDYGDEGVVEFIFAELISLFKGLGNKQWGAEPIELKGRTFGIIGFGTTGQMVAQAARSFGMHVLYYSRTRQQELESTDIQYVPLPELLEKSDVLSTHLPRRTKLLGAAEFSLMKPGTVLVNTSLGATFDKVAFFHWVSQDQNFAIIDADGALTEAEEYKKYPNILLSDKVAGWTVEARNRLSEKVIQNIHDYLSAGMVK